MSNFSLAEKIDFCDDKAAAKDGTGIKDPARRLGSKENLVIN